MIPALGPTPAKLQAIHIQSYYRQALASGRRDGTGGLSAQTVVHHARVLSVALRRARALRLIATNPIDDTSQPKVPRQEIAVLEPAEAAALLNTARSTGMFALVFLALATGLRRGEILGLRWCDVDLEGRRLTVAQSLEQTVAGGLKFKAPKTKRSRRTIALSLALVRGVADLPGETSNRTTCPRDGTEPAGLVFSSIDGAPLRPDGVTWRFAKLVRPGRSEAYQLPWVAAYPCD